MTDQGELRESTDFTPAALLPYYPEPSPQEQEQQPLSEEDAFFESIPFRSPHRNRKTSQVDPFEKHILIKFARQRSNVDWKRYQQWHGYGCQLYPDAPSSYIHQWLADREFLWQKGLHEMMTQAEFDATHEAFVALPDSVALEDEVNWVKSHRRLFELRQLYDGKTPEHVDTSLTADEILRPANGPAPSKGAVTMLQQAMRNPDHFWKLVFSKRASTPVRSAGRPRKERPPEDESDEPDPPAPVDVWDDDTEEVSIF